jgi:two-component system, sensor histidine kinase RpfC
MRPSQGTRPLFENLRARLRQRPDTEHVQILIRIGMSLAFIALFLVVEPKDVFPDKNAWMTWPTVGAHALISFALLPWLILRPEVNHWRRGIGMAADYGVAGIALVFGGEAGTLMGAVLIWCTIGYGVRFGRRYLHAAIAAATLVVAFAWTLSACWTSHPYIAASISIATIIVPLYISRWIGGYQRALQKAREAGQVKDRFLAQMSHEFRTPLNGIMGMSELMLTTDMPADQRKPAEMIYSSSQTLLSMIEDILDVAAIEGGRIQVRTSDFDLTALLARLARAVEPNARLSGLQFSVTSDPLVPQFVHGDSKHLYQALLGLTNNAVKFTPSGSVTVHVAPGQVSTGHIRLRFSIRDTGIGVPEHLRDEIFEPFRQLDSGHDRTFSGMGLGASIARTLTEAMGGRIGLEANPGGGSHFYIDLPLGLVSPLDFRRSEPASEAAKEPLVPPMVSESSSVVRFDDPFARHRETVPQQHVLVVDDQVSNRVLLQMLLERAGHTVSFATDGASALEQIQASHPDQVVLDLHMPGMSGIDVIRQLREIEAGRRHRTPVVMLSADATEVAVRAMQEVSNIVLSKPVNILQLLEAISRGASGAEALPATPRSAQASTRAQHDALAELAHVDASEEFLTGYVEQAFADIQGSIDRLQTLVGRPDARPIRESLHAIAGVARNISAFELANLTRTLMDLPPDQLNARAVELPAQITECTARARVEVSRRVKKLVEDFNDPQLVISLGRSLTPIG